MADGESGAADATEAAGPPAQVEALELAPPLGLSAAFTDRTGVVAAFDDHLGSGTVGDVATGERWAFHCTRIADGARTVPVGAAVRFRIDVGPTGLEAVDVMMRTNS